MPDKDVDEQFAAIMAHWDDVALGIDPVGDPLADEGEGTDGESAPTGGPRDGSDLGRSPGTDDAAPRSATVAEPGPPSEAMNARPTAPTLPPAPPNPAPPADGKTPGPTTAPGPLPDDDAPPVIGSGWRQHDPPDVEEHFVPPPPAPLPSADDKHFWLMLVGLIGGPLLFLYLILFARDGNGWWMMFALGMAIAGFVLLVLRQPTQRDENDDGVRL